MSFSASSWSSTLEGLMAGLAMAGPDVPKFAGAVGEGSVKTLVGKSFASLDVGVGAGGEGKGIGLIVPPSIATPIIIATSTASFGSAGFALPLLALAVDLAMVIESLKASLSSVSILVGTGSGVIVPGTIPVTGAEWGANITSAGVSRGFTGPSWPSFANALGAGMAASFKLAAGSVVITGPGGPSPTGGAGKGTIS